MLSIEAREALATFGEKYKGRKPETQKGKNRFAPFLITLGALGAAIFILTEGNGGSFDTPSPKVQIKTGTGLISLPRKIDLNGLPEFVPVHGGTFYRDDQLAAGGVTGTGSVLNRFEREQTNLQPPGLDSVETGYYGSAGGEIGGDSFSSP